MDYRRCKSCGKILPCDQDFLCVDCADMDSSGASDILQYIYTYFPLPVNHSALSGEAEKENERVMSRSILFIAADRVLSNPFDDPYDTVMDLLIELHQYGKREDYLPDLQKLEIEMNALCDLRHYLLNLGFGIPAISRY